MRVRDRGFALILVLLAAAAVFALAVPAAVLSRAAAVESRVVIDRTRAERDARSAVVMVLTGLGMTAERFARLSAAPGASADGPSPPGRPDKPRIEIPEIIRQVLGDRLKEVEDEARKAVGDARLTDGGGLTGRVAPPGRRGMRLTMLPVRPVIVRVEESGPAYVVTLRDATGLLNVNTATRERLLRYFDAVGVEPVVASDLASQIIDWRDEDDFTEPGGAEQRVYSQRGITCRNAPLKSLEELRYLPVMTPELFERVRGDLSVAGGETVHLGTASKAILLSLPGMTPEAADSLIESRAGGPIREEDLERMLPLHAREAKSLIRLAPSPIIKVRVDVVGDTRIVFEGLAVVDDEGIRGVGLRPLL